MKTPMRQAMGMALLCGVALSSRAAAREDHPLLLGQAGYFQMSGVDWLVFSNSYDGLFADAKISGVELIQQGVRTATNGDVRLSATPGQWDPIGRLVSRKVDAKTGIVEAVLEYADFDFPLYRSRRAARQ